MTDHKFTDDELQRCIECCIKGKVWGDCKKLNCPAIRKQGCHFYLRTDDDYENTIYIEILKDALALIKRQKAEIDDMKVELDAMRGAANSYKMHYEEAERKYKIAVAEREANVEGFIETLKTIKAEAIKEFAERLKASKIKPEFPWDNFFVTEDTIDTLVKEMTEENK
jgi:hypothetical protein